MTRRVSGYFREHRRGDRSPSSLAPYLLARFGPEPSTDAIEMLIDTGADWTTLGPIDALTLFGRSYLELEFDNDPRKIELSGFGQGNTTAVLSLSDLWLHDTSGEDCRISLPIAICKPTPQIPGAHGIGRYRHYSGATPYAT